MTPIVKTATSLIGKEAAGVKRNAERYRKNLVSRLKFFSNRKKGCLNESLVKSLGEIGAF